MKQECNHLINDYLCHNNKIFNNGFHVVSKEELKDTLHNLISFERPDMYAVLDDKIIIIEHFEFDASKAKSNGALKGKEEERLLCNRMNEHITNSNEHYIDKGTYEISFEYWKTNFERIFKDHYNKISEYKNNVLQTVNDGKEDQIIVGFFIENQYPPYVHYNHDFFALCYWQTKQFYDVMNSSTDLDFVLFAGYFEGERRVFYFDKLGIEKMNHLFDLNDKDLILSPVNKNEITMRMDFSIKLGECKYV